MRLVAKVKIAWLMVVSGLDKEEVKWEVTENGRDKGIIRLWGNGTIGTSGMW